MEILTERRNIMDILDKMQFFQGQRVWRELWNDRPQNVKERDLDSFNRDIRSIRDYIWDLEHELKSFRDAEEQGLLLRLPCKVGDCVFEIRCFLDCDCDYDCIEHDKYKCELNSMCEHEYKKYRIKEQKFNIQMLDELGKTIFPTREEAEQALEKMKGE